jgi:hypothetical protein
MCLQGYYMDISPWMKWQQNGQLSQWYSAGLRPVWSAVRAPKCSGNFSLHHRVQTGSGANPAFFPMGTRVAFLGVKRPGHEADHSPPTSAKVKNAGAIPPLSQYAFKAWCSVKKEHRDGMTEKWPVFTLRYFIVLLSTLLFFCYKEIGVWYHSVSRCLCSCLLHNNSWTN